MTDTGSTAQVHPAAWVDDEPLATGEVEAELARLRSGPRAASLPLADSSEGRQLRRWVVHTLVARRLLEHEAERRGFDAASAPRVEEVLPSRAAALGLGGLLASALRQSPAARAVYAAVTGDVRVCDDDVQAYLARNGGPGSGAVADAARALLTEARKREAFLDWHSEQAATRVRLEPGHEHPGDPHQPDATHRH